MSRARPQAMKGLDVRILHSGDDLSALADEWNDLTLRCPGYYLVQTFQWAKLAWEIIGQPRGYELNCLTLRFEERLVAVWPLIVRRHRGLRIIRPLTFEGDEYCAPLAEPGDEAGDRVALLWQAAARVADLAILPHVRADSPLASVLKAGSHWSVSYGGRSPYVARADYADWAAYHATISSNLRYQIRRQRRRLAKKGKVVIEREGVAGRAALIDWTLDQKRHWLVRSNRTNDWMSKPDSRDFLIALSAREDATGSLGVFALKLDDVPLAACFVYIDRSRVEYYFPAYDFEWSTYTPGAILIEDLVQWAFERDLDFDFRIGDQPYKYKWAKRGCHTAHWKIATGSRGIPMVVHQRVMLFASQLRQKFAMGRFLPSKWRDRLKVLMHRAKSQTPT